MLSDVFRLRVQLLVDIRKVRIHDQTSTHRWRKLSLGYCEAEQRGQHHWSYLCRPGAILRIKADVRVGLCGFAGHH